LDIGQALFWAALVLYGLAGLLYLGNLLELPEKFGSVARKVMLAGFAAQMGLITAHGFAGLHPVSSLREAVSFLAWVLVGAFLLAQLRRRLDSVGAFVAPAAIMMLASAQIAPAGVPGMTAGLGVVGRVHISLATAGVSIFALATGLAVLYLMQERQLKSKRVGTLVKKGTSLETLDHLAHRCVQVGFPLFTVAMVTGALWSARLTTELRPEYAMAAVAWTAFAALLVARTTVGWRGRRAAILTIVGFGAALIVVAIYLARAAT
jgi:ABC-type uncharacterized transport system permease subunit